MGLTNPGRPGKKKPRQTTIWSLLPMVARVNSTKQKDRSGSWQNSGRSHPRGMLGKTHSAVTKARFSRERTGRRMPPISDETRQRMSMARANLLRSNPAAAARGNRGKVGRRADVNNQYFRSSWEANYARYMNYAGIKWEYEPRTFRFDKISRGCISYTPDFYLPELNCYHEVKGWMDDKSRVKLARMAKYYPEAKIVVIDSKWFASAERNGLCSVIPGWECKHTAAKAPPRT